MAVKLAVELAVWLVVLLVLILWFVRYCNKRRMRLRSEQIQEFHPIPPPIISNFTLEQIQEFHPIPPPIISNFTLEQIQEFTDGFSEVNLLGEGGFGLVYRGVLPNGKAIAVKRLKEGSGQGEREFETEIEIISQVHHKHVVSLVGYCTTGSERMLVYELVPNKTLEFHLHGEGQPILDWETRMKIALGSAKGLAYLHEDCHRKIIHRDIKAANILVDNEFEPKIADFGLAKCTSDANSHVFTNVKGTTGYLDPEYALSGNLTAKSDTYAFGVVLLELISGHSAVGSTHNSMDDRLLVNWAKPLIKQAQEDGNFDLIVDPKLQNNYRKNEMTRMVGCAAACVYRSVEHRPTMSEIVRALKGDLPLSNPSDGITIFRGSSDCGTSHHNKPASEHGLYPSGSSSMGPRRQTN